ncbi:hypothetical protein HDU79_007343 [Rhizoclosmatium sp. JEL0117]|nr:hypothetical protein HDU79_007343 [Rhizoclosmatium sp. JEL0117]
MIDNTAVHSALLQSILELKSEVNTKADKLIILLHQVFPSSTSARQRPLNHNTELHVIPRPVQISSTSLKSNHLDFGLRWDIADFAVPTDFNNSAPPPLFKVKTSTSANISSLSITKRSATGASGTHIPEFAAFRQKKQGSSTSIASSQVERRAKSPLLVRKHMGPVDLKTIDSGILSPSSERIDSLRSRALLQASNTSGLNKKDSTQSSSLNRAVNKIKTQDLNSLQQSHSLQSDGTGGVASLDRRGTLNNYGTLVNHGGTEVNIFPQDELIDAVSMAPRISVTEVISQPNTTLPHNSHPPESKMQLSSGSSLDANASVGSFNSQEMQDFIHEVQAMKAAGPTDEHSQKKAVASRRGSYDQKPLGPTSPRESVISRVTDIASPYATLERSKLLPNSIKYANVTNQSSVHRAPPVASTMTFSINSGNEPDALPKTTLSGLIYDIFSYSCLIPAYDSKGRRITLDQFDSSDFDGISFRTNGLHPKSILITYVDCFMVIVYVTCLAEVPFVIGFNSVLPDFYGKYFSIIITVVFCLDSLVQLSTPNSHIGKTTIYSIREYESLRPFLKAWIREWLTSYLLLDLVSIIPFCAILGQDTSWLRLLRLVRILRLGQITTRCAIFTRVKLFVEERIGVASAKILPIGIGIIVFLHYNACAIFYAGQMNGFLGWSQYWVQTQTETVWDSYLWCFVLAVGNLFPMSYKPQTKMEQFFAILFIFVGAGVYAVLVGYISSAAISVDNSGRLYNQKMEELKDYITWRQLNNETKDKLISYYETKYRGKYFEEDTLLGDMNEALRTEIALHNTFDLITKVPFLRRSAGDGRDEIFYARIASFLHIRYYIAGDCVTKEGDSGADMFFILSGKLDIVIGGEVYKSLYDGAYFGEVALINKVLRTVTVQAKMPSVLYRLTYQDFHTVINEFSDIKARIAELAQERERMLMKVGAVALEKRS